ncbi:MAG: 50S ribosomal protein L6 [Anaerolineae bacterium]
MSRIGLMPIPIPSGVQVTVEPGNQVTVKGPRGSLIRSFSPDLKIEVTDGQVVVARPSDARHHRALHGLTRALLANMVTGVSQGFRKELEIVGVGYRAELQGQKLVLFLGFSHPVEVEPPAGIHFEVDRGGRKFSVLGIDKELVGEVAAKIRAKRPPEPYKGKGVRYVGEYVRVKAGKSGKAA